MLRKETKYCFMYNGMSEEIESPVFITNFSDFL